MWTRFAPRLRKTVVVASELAADEGSDTVTERHLMLAICRDEAAAATFMLDYCGVPPGTLRAMLACNGRTATAATAVAGRLSDVALETLRRAALEADELDDPHVGTEHLLLALAWRTDSAEAPNGAAAALRDLGVSHAEALAAREAWLLGGMPRSRIPIEPVAWRGRALGPMRKVFAPIVKTARLLALGYRVYVLKGLGHPKYVTNPYPLYRTLRRRNPVRRDPVAPVWVVTSYNETLAMLRDPRFRKEPYLSDALPDAARAQLGLPSERDAAIEGEPLAMLFIDPPRHTRIRAMFNKGFSARAMAGLRPRVEQIACTLLDRAADTARTNGELDVIRELAVPLPVAVIAELIGFPPRDFDRLKKWSDDFAAALTVNPTPAQVAASNRSREEMREYFHGVVEEMLRTPGDNLISTLLPDSVDLRETADGTNGKLTRAELFANCALLMAAGHETTTNLIGNGLLGLLSHPSQLRLLLKEPELIGAAVEEMLRYDPPVQWTSRVANEAIRLGGQSIARGDIVLASLGAANRDPRVFDEPDRFDIRRANNRHLAFGQGIHFCLGAALARMEAEIAIGMLLSRFPRVRLARNANKVKWSPGIIFRGTKSLRVRVD